MNKLIVFTGGHHNSALVLAKLFKKNSYRILWLGHKYSMVKNRNVSVEYQEVSKLGMKFIELKSGKISQDGLGSYLKTIGSIIRCLFLFIKNKPNLIISFGGYLSFPAVFAGYLLRIPSVSHEQTTILGMANRANLPFVKKIYLNWEIDELKNNPKANIIGLPSEAKSTLKLSRDEFNKQLFIWHKQSFGKTNKAIIFISGGKQGSAFINKLIENNLEILLNKYNLIHQTGDNSYTQDFKRLLNIKLNLDKKMQSSYIVLKYSPYFWEILKHCDLVIGRSGAHTIYDVILAKKKMLAIPLPFAYKNEQKQNAKLLESLGLGIILDQEEIENQTFLSQIEKLLKSKIDLNHIDNFIKDKMCFNSAEAMYNDIIRNVL